MGDFQFIEPSAPTEFHSSGGHPIEVLDFTPERRGDPFQPKPSLLQRMAGVSIEERRPSTRIRRDSTMSKNRNFVYWRLEKVGEDWETARKQMVPAPQDEIEKLAKKGSVLKETQKMGKHRLAQLDRLVDDANYDESGDAIWEPVYIKSIKELRKSNVLACRSMDVILARVARTVKDPKGRSKFRSASVGGQIVNVSDFRQSTDRDKDKDKKKDKDEWGKEHKKKDSVLDDDPFGASKLFHNNGKPMDERGIIEYSNGGLPAEIPRDEPIGKRPEKKKEKDGKRGKSKDRDEPEVLDFGEPLPLGGGGGGDTLEAILGDGPRSRRGSRSGPIEVVSPRSRSRNRPSRSASHRRSGSRPRPESIRYPPNFHTRSWVGDGSGSSISSEESRYGLEREEMSSRTSQDTFYDMAGRGSRYDDDARHPGRYKEHRRGSSHSKYYYDDPEPFERRGSRRYSRAYHEPIPESHQIEYYGPARGDVMAGRRYDDVRSPRDLPVQLHHPNELVDLNARERSAETYMRNNVRDEFLDRREYDIARREQNIRDAEYDQRRRYSSYGDGGGYYHR